MKSPLAYLLLIRIKNRLLSLVRSPGKIIYVIFIIALLILSISGGSRAPLEASELRDIRELYAGVFGLFLILFLVIANNGFGEGASLFTQADVNLVFPAPLPPRRVLFFGLFQQIGTSIVLGFFLLFQYSWMHNLYGVGFGAILMILVGYALDLFLAQLTAMTIYSMTSADEGLRRRVKTVCLIVLILCGAVLLWYLASGEEPLKRLVEAGNSLPARLFPVAGWTAGFAAGLITGESVPLISGLLLSAAYAGLLVLLITRSRQDYYEDVLKASEKAHLTAAAKREGRVADLSRRKVRLGRSLDRGEGANTFYYKHIIENRRSRVFLLGGLQLLFAAIIIVFAAFTRNLGVLPAFLFATYMQFFSVALGRFPKELMKHFVYLVPEKPFAKLLQCMRESFAGAVLEAVVVFLPVGLILGFGPPEILCLVLARVSFTFLFQAGSVLVGRVFGMVTSKVFAMLFYVLSILVMALPGVAAAILLGVFDLIPWSRIDMQFLALGLCNIFVSLLTLFLCRDLLLYSELN